jgi:hypothetical protein
MPYRKTGVWSVSGFKLDVSSGTHLSEQTNEALVFLEHNEVELTRLSGFDGVEDVRLDFGLNRRSVAVQSEYLSPRLLRLAGTLGIGIELSVYDTE